MTDVDPWDDESTGCDSDDQGQDDPVKAALSRFVLELAESGELYRMVDDLPGRSAGTQFPGGGQ